MKNTTEGSRALSRFAERYGGKQKDLAAACGVSYPRLRKLITAELSPTLAETKEINAATGIAPFAWLS